MAWAFRMGKPSVITEITPSTLNELNRILEQFWEISNGRVTSDIVTSNPNAAPARTGTTGDSLLYNNGGSWKQCFNIDGGTTWRCDSVALTAP